MAYLMTLSLSGLVGAGLGYLVGRARIGRLSQSLGAALLGWIAGTTTRVAIWLLRNSSDWGVAAVSVGLVEVGMSAALTVLVAGLLHWILGWLGSTVSPSVAAYRPAILGFVGGLWAQGRSCLGSR